MQVEKLDHLERLIDVELEIEATYTFQRGDYHDPRIEEIDIESVLTEDGEEWELSSSDERRAKELLWEQVWQTNEKGRRKSPLKFYAKSARKMRKNFLTIYAPTLTIFDVLFHAIFDNRAIVTSQSKSKKCAFFFLI